MQAGPDPGMPTEGGIAGKITCRLGNLVGIGRVRFQQPLCERTIALADAVDLVRWSVRRGEAEALIGVVGNENGCVIIFPG